MECWLQYLFIGSLIVIIVTDSVWQVIPNYISLPLLLTGLFQGGYSGTWGASLLGAGIWFALGLACFMLGGMAGGDVKLMAAVGAWTGVAHLLSIILLAGLIGLLWSLAQAARNGLFGQQFRYIVTFPVTIVSHGLVQVLRGSKLPEENTTRGINVVPYGACICLATLIIRICTD